MTIKEVRTGRKKIIGAEVGLFLFGSQDLALVFRHTHRLSLKKVLDAINSAYHKAKFSDIHEFQTGEGITQSHLDDFSASSLGEYNLTATGGTHHSIWKMREATAKELSKQRSNGVVFPILGTSAETVELGVGDVMLHRSTDNRPAQEREAKPSGPIAVHGVEHIGVGNKPNELAIVTLS